MSLGYGMLREILMWLDTEGKSINFARVWDMWIKLNITAMVWDALEKLITVTSIWDTTARMWDDYGVPLLRRGVT
jgi:hypothetical protein